MEFLTASARSSSDVFTPFRETRSVEKCLRSNRLTSPNPTLLLRVHPRSPGAGEGVAELPAVADRAGDAEGARRVDVVRRLERQRLFRLHRTPNLQNSAQSTENPKFIGIVIEWMISPR